MSFYLLFSSVLCSFLYSLEHNSCCACFFFFILFSLSLVSLCWSYICIEVVVSVVSNSPLSDHYFVHFLEKEECFNVNQTSGSLTYCTHHHENSRWSLSFISLLICYSCSFCFYAFMLVAIWE